MKTMDKTWTICKEYAFNVDMKMVQTQNMSVKTLFQNYFYIAQFSSIQFFISLNIENIKQALYIAKHVILIRKKV